MIGLVDKRRLPFPSGEKQPELEVEIYLIRDTFLTKVLFPSLTLR